MKSYTITVNGKAYDVTVEETGSTPSIPVAAPAAAPKASGTAGNVKVEAGAAGKVFKVEASVGQNVKAGDTILVLEVMKMETPVVAPKDGTVATIDVSEGQSVESGALLATLNA
ncbi:MAG: biotin/lipoyl-binding protein [Lachnospiraceae bacterium]|nr:biotin/lipoyl-binding protein [Lachnospiraceae bacterium]